jgi:hypothetical protein
MQCRGRGAGASGGEQVIEKERKGQGYFHRDSIDTTAISKALSRLGCSRREEKRKTTARHSGILKAESCTVRQAIL